MTPTVTPSITPSVTITPSPSATLFGWLQNGGSFSADSATACSNYASSGQWYTNTTMISGGVRLYSDSGLTTPVVGNGTWIAINGNFTGGVKYAVTVDASGYIGSVVTCP